MLVLRYITVNECEEGDFVLRGGARCEGGRAMGRSQWQKG